MASSAFPQTFPTNIREGIIFCSAAGDKINCHDKPYLSWTHPYLSLNGYLSSGIRTVPPSDNLSHSSFISPSVLQFTKKDIEGLILNMGPPLSATNSCSSIWNAAVIRDPFGLPAAFAPASS